jgi:hypothetical protein
MSTLTLHLPENLKIRLTRAARRARKSPARFARETLEQHLKPVRGRSARGSSLYDLSRDLCGSVNGGPSDLAANKKHLNGYGSWKR